MSQITIKVSADIDKELINEVVQKRVEEHVRAQINAELTLAITRAEPKIHATVQRAMTKALDSIDHKALAAEIISEKVNAAMEKELKREVHRVTPGWVKNHVRQLFDAKRLMKASLEITE